MFLDIHEMEHFIRYFNNIGTIAEIKPELLDNLPWLGSGAVERKDATLLMFNIYTSSELTESVVMTTPKDSECNIIISDQMFNRSPMMMQNRIHTKMAAYRQIHRYMMASQFTIDERIAHNPITSRAIQYLTEPATLNYHPEDQSFFHHRFPVDNSPITERSYFNSIFVALCNGGVNIKELEVDLESYRGHTLETYLAMLHASVEHISNEYVIMEMNNRIRKLMQMKRDTPPIALPEAMNYEIYIEMH